MSQFELFHGQTLRVLGNVVTMPDGSTAHLVSKGYGPHNICLIVVRQRRRYWVLAVSAITVTGGYIIDHVLGQWKHPR